MARRKSDGSIVIDTKMKEEGIIDGVNKIKSAFGRMASTLNKFTSGIWNNLKGKTAVPTQEYIDIQRQIEKAQAKLDALIEKQKKFFAIGGSEESHAYKSMEYDMNELAKEIEYATRELRELEATGRAFTIEKEFDDAKESVDGFNDSMEKAEKKTKRVRYGMGKMLVQSVLFSMVFRAISTVVSGATDGMNNLAKYSNDTNATLSMLISSLTQLKNAFATAFSPILTAVAPVLNYLINLLSSAATAVAQLMAALTGKNTFVKASKVQQNYVDSLNKTAGAAEDAEKALASFDKLNVQQNNSASGVGSSAVSPSEMFETVKVDPTVISGVQRLRSLLQPTINSIKELKKNVIPFLKESGELGGWIADVIFEPFLTWLLESALPNSIELIGDLFDLLTLGLEWFNENALPFIEPVITDFLNMMFRVFDGVLMVLDGILEFLLGIFTNDWERAFSGLNLIGQGFLKAFESIWNFIEKYIMIPFDKFLSQVFATDWIKWYGVLGEVLIGFSKSVEEIWGGIKKIFEGIHTFVSGVFTGDWQKAWNGIKQIFEGTWDVIAGIIKAQINVIIGFVNGMLSAIQSGMNGLIGGLNKILDKIPDSIPIVGSLHFNDVTIPKIPYLASGTVVPPRAGEFAAILGDNTRETEVVSPLSTMKQALKEALRESGAGGGGDIVLTVNLEGKQIYKEVVKQNKAEKNRTGLNPLMA